MLKGKILIAGICLAAFAMPATAQSLTVAVHPAKSTAIREDQEETRAIPGNATLADRSAWKDRRGATVKDVTDYIPGVYTQPRNGAESSRLSLRGSGLANVFQGTGLLVLQDGVPVNMADGEFEFPVIDPWLIDYALILPGANALEDGASTLGGAIDFKTPTGSSRGGYELRGEAGSFGTLQGLASTGTSWSGGDLFAAASGFRQQGFRDHNQEDISRFNLTGGWRTNDDVSQRIYASHTESNAEIPGAITRAAIADDAAQANPANARGRYERNLDITRLAHKGIWQDGPDRLDSTLYYTYRTLDNPVTTYITEDNNDGGARLKYTKNLGLDKWTAGANLAYGSQDETRHANVRGHEGAHLLDRDLYALTSEIYTQYEHHLAGGLSGIASLQTAYDTRDIKQETPTRDEQNKSFTGTNPRLGLRYDLDADTQFFTNLSRSFEPPTWAELSGGNSPGFNDLDAQTATTAEIGGRGKADRLTWSAAYYRSRLRDEFVNYQFADGSSDTINAGKSVHEGIELGASGDVMKNIFANDDAVELRAAYAWNHFHLDDDRLYGDNQLPGIPEHYLRAEFLYRHPDGFAAGPNIEWSPSAYPVDLTDTLKADGYAVLGARALWQNQAKTFDFFVEGRNLTDRAYAATTNVVPNANGVDGRYFYPGEGRSLYTGFSIRF